MRHLAFLPLLLLFPAPVAAADGQMRVPSCAAGTSCGYYDQELVRREAAAQQAALERVHAMLARGEATPEADARAAAAAGNFRLIWSSGFGSLAVTGGHCRFPLTHPESRRAPFTLFERSVSDAIDDSARGRAEVEAGRRLDDYALRYNRTMRADSRFPYPDLCAVQIETRRLRGLPGLHQPDSLAPPARVETDAPRNLGEAVRRGTLRAVRRMLAGIDPATLDRRDDFGLTPLAWAVIDNRPDVARLLLASGADPLGGCVAPWGEMEALPLGLALVKSQRALADAMLTPAVRARLQPWPRDLVERAARGNHEPLLREMLTAPGTDANIIQVLQAVIETGSPALRREIATSSPGAAGSFLFLAITRSNPALVREALALRPLLVAERNGRRSPLGFAVTTESAAVDEMVGLLLAAGAPADSPADFGRGGYPTGSTPPTALVALVAVADRIHPGMAGRTEPEYARRMAAQRRALDLLLTAGASVRATDSYHRPLSVLALTGRYDPRGVNTRAELPEGWLTRLAQAGMDVNATWLGSTALDWADALGMADTATARELVRLGGRRTRPADTSGGSRF